MIMPWWQAHQPELGGCAQSAWLWCAAQLSLLNIPILQLEDTDDHAHELAIRQFKNDSIVLGIAQEVWLRL